jgi:diguanylate cyclase (GGDEF)-like protein
MTDPGGNGEQGLSLANSHQKWQGWILALILVAVGGIIFGIYGALTSPSSAWSRDQVARLIPPVLFGLISLAVLTAFYVAQKQAIIRVLQDALLRQKMEAELNREMTLLDPVTEVYNRRYLRAILHREVGRAKRHNAGLSVMMLDIMRFRRVNESLGQTAGDAVLKEVAHLIQRRIRNSDSLVRYGGDEFLVVLSEANPAAVDRLCERLRRGLDEWSLQNNMAEFQLAFALGISHYQPNEPVDELLRRAERQMQEEQSLSRAAPSKQEKAVFGASAN